MAVGVYLHLTQEHDHEHLALTHDHPDQHAGATDPLTLALDVQVALSLTALGRHRSAVQVEGDDDRRARVECSREHVAIVRVGKMKRRDPLFVALNERREPEAALW